VAKKARLSDEVLAYFRKVGAKGGRVVAAKMTPAERSARASKGGHARAAKARKAKG